MGWSWHKSIRFGRRSHINLSTRGVGFSTGLRGLRINVGPRGAFLNASKWGFTFRKKIAGGIGSLLLRGFVWFVVLAGLAAAAIAIFIYLR